MLPGVLIGIAPWLVEQQHDQFAILNAALVGVLGLALLATQEMEVRHESQRRDA